MYFVHSIYVVDNCKNIMALFNSIPLPRAKVWTILGDIMCGVPASMWCAYWCNNRQTNLGTTAHINPIRIYTYTISCCFLFCFFFLLTISIYAPLLVLKAVVFDGIFYFSFYFSSAHSIRFCSFVCLFVCSMQMYWSLLTVVVVVVAGFFFYHCSNPETNVSQRFAQMGSTRKW